MDSLGLKRRRKPKVFEGFHTGNEISGAFKNKAKVKADVAKGNVKETEDNHEVDVEKENVEKENVEKENIVCTVVDDTVAKETIIYNSTRQCSETNQSNASDHISEEDATGLEPVSHRHIITPKKRIKRKCSEKMITTETAKLVNTDEAPRTSKKAKADVIVNVSKNYTKIKDKISGSKECDLLSSEESVESGNETNEIKCTSTDLKKLKREPKEQFCNICEKVNGDLLACSGLCLSQFHPNCLGLNLIPTCSFTCDECTTDCHTCFICHNIGGTKKCSQNTCGKYFHIQCLENNDCTKFENKAKEKFTCPLHVCKYCVGSKSPKMTIGKKVVKCIRCPVAYHQEGFCLPAGCMMLSPNHMICDEHFEAPKNSSVHTQINTTWCIICSYGGSLVCCDTCPASFHSDCSEDLDGIPEGAWQCRDCRDGNKLRYGDIVWVKFSIYRWWPGKICFPEEVPTRVQTISHAIGEFPVLFFGSRDYAWLSSRRVFKYAEGDMGGSNTKTYLEKYFQKALEEAKNAFHEKEKKREEHIQAFVKKQSNKPQPYGHIKVNRPISCIRTALDRSEWPICHCKANDPCEKECLNKMLYYECNPLQCPNKENCKNQRIQKFEYAKIKLFKGEEKGWGLNADQEIKMGDFVIEYIGELIDEATCRIRIQQYHEKDVYDYYFLTIDKDNIIDAYPRGNLSRFMNHSCDPNCETQKWMVNGEVHVGLFATRDISIGEELSFNYNLDSLGNEKKKCKCRSANCSGYLGVQPKTQHSISVAEKSKKSKEKTSEKRKLKRRTKIKVVHDDECFTCGDGGQLLCCDRQNCTKAYHQDCLIMEEAPKGKWQCPWHFCDECGKLAKSMCSLCPNSFCESHLDGQMIELKDDVIVCPSHDEEEMENLMKEKVDETSDLKQSFNSSSPKMTKSSGPSSKNVKKVSGVNKPSKSKKKITKDTSLDLPMNKEILKTSESPGLVPNIVDGVIAVDVKKPRKYNVSVDKKKMRDDKVVGKKIGKKSIKVTDGKVVTKKIGKKSIKVTDVKVVTKKVTKESIKVTDGKVVMKKVAKESIKGKKVVQKLKKPNVKDAKKVVTSKYFKGKSDERISMKDGTGEKRNVDDGKKVVKSKYFEGKSDVRISMIGEKRKYLKNATQKAENLKKVEKKNEEKLTLNMNTKTDNEITNGRKVSQKAEVKTPVTSEVTVADKISTEFSVDVSKLKSVTRKNEMVNKERKKRGRPPKVHPDVSRFMKTRN